MEFVLKILIFCLNTWLSQAVIKTEKFSFIQPSIFPQVPPYIRFQAPGTLQRIPKALKRELIWPSIPGTPKLGHDSTIRATGLRLLPMSQSICPHILSATIFGWYDRPKACSKREVFSALLEYQKIKYWPGIHAISYKDVFWDHLKKLMAGKSRRTFPNIIPAFSLPNELEEFRQASISSKNKLWIYKPAKLSMVRGVRLLKHWSEADVTERALVQEYMPNPYLFQNRKVELKIYFMVTSVSPLRVYTFPTMLGIRVGQRNYSLARETLDDLCIHAHTSTPEFPCRANVQEEMWTESTDVIDQLHNEHVNIPGLFRKIERILIISLLSVQNVLAKAARTRLHNSYNAFHVLNADFFLDEHLKPWLLEINSKPIVSVEKSPDSDEGLIWHPEFYAEAWTVAGYHFPPFLSSEAQAVLRNAVKARIPYFTGKSLTFPRNLYERKLTRRELKKQQMVSNLTLDSILNDLTPDDIRQLVIAEDEYSRVRISKRIFPTSSLGEFKDLVGSAEYYYYKLFQAWELKFAGNRKAGRKLLQAEINRSKLKLI